MISQHQGMILEYQTLRAIWTLTWIPCSNYTHSRSSFLLNSRKLVLGNYECNCILLSSFLSCLLLRSFQFSLRILLRNLSLWGQEGSQFVSHLVCRLRNQDESSQKKELGSPRLRTKFHFWCFSLWEFAAIDTSNLSFEAVESFTLSQFFNRCDLQVIDSALDSR